MEIKERKNPEFLKRELFNNLEEMKYTEIIKLAKEIHLLDPLSPLDLSFVLPTPKLISFIDSFVERNNCYDVCSIGCGSGFFEIMWNKYFHFSKEKKRVFGLDPYYDDKAYQFLPVSLLIDPEKESCLEETVDKIRTLFICFWNDMTTLVDTLISNFQLFKNCQQILFLMCEEEREDDPNGDVFVNVDDERFVHKVNEKLFLLHSSDEDHINNNKQRPLLFRLLDKRSVTDEYMKEQEKDYRNVPIFLYHFSLSH